MNPRITLWVQQGGDGRDWKGSWADPSTRLPGLGWEQWWDVVREVPAACACSWEAAEGLRAGRAAPEHSELAWAHQCPDGDRIRVDPVGSELLFQGFNWERGCPSVTALLSLQEANDHRSKPGTPLD